MLPSSTMPPTSKRTPNTDTVVNVATTGAPMAAKPTRISATPRATNQPHDARRRWASPSGSVVNRYGCNTCGSLGSAISASNHLAAVDGQAELTGGDPHQYDRQRR